MTLREIQLYASSATQKESYALDYFRHSTRALATWVHRTCGWRFHSYPLSNCRNRTGYPVGDRSDTLTSRNRKSSCDVNVHVHSQPSVSLRIINMNKLKFKGSWNEIKGKLKQKYAQLTDDDLKYAEGKDDELIGRLQKKLGKSADEVRHILES